MKKLLIVDRDGTLVVEPPEDMQIDSLEKLEFYPKVFHNLHFILKHLDFELVMASNQDGLGTAAYPEATFWPAQNKIIQAFAGEGVTFSRVLIDPSMPADHSPNRKPGTGMFTDYLASKDYDIPASIVIGDRITDVELAYNLGCKAILLNDGSLLDGRPELQAVCLLATTDWDRITELLFAGERRATVKRTTAETDISITLDLDGNGKCDITTGLHFFDHLLQQIGKHSGIDLSIHVKGDLDVDEHHTIEDTAIALGEAIYSALGSKRGIERYGFCLPMDDCQCTVALDFGGRPWIVWDAEYRREKIGDVPTEMFFHFFKSLSDAARMNLHIKATGDNEHHKIEGTFKALARALKMAIRRDIYHFALPSTKGVI